MSVTALAVRQPERLERLHLKLEATGIYLYLALYY
jgi:hypothetical protein